MSSFGSPCVDNFCMCFPLKKGGKIIAYLCLVASVISCIMLTIYLCSDLEKIKKEIADNNAGMAAKLNKTSGSAQFCAGLMLVLSLALLVSSVFLIHGIKLKSQKKIFPFLIVLAITILLTSVVAIIQFQKGAFFASMTLIVLLVYFFICIYSLYKSLDDSEFVQHDIGSN